MFAGFSFSSIVLWFDSDNKDKYIRKCVLPGKKVDLGVVHLDLPVPYYVTKVEDTVRVTGEHLVGPFESDV